MTGVSIQAQSVLFHTELAGIETAMESLNRSIEIARHDGRVSEATVEFGDCSPTPMLDDEVLGRWRETYSSVDRLGYEFFGENLGSARAHNRLADKSTSELILTTNPDVVPAPRALEQLIGVFADDLVGIAEAKQVPIEHPKDFDKRSGATSWCATAFSLISRSVFDKVGGFDAETFFLYCDDVDFSWRVRLRGYSAVFQPAAVVFHDKRVSLDGKWLPTSAERYFSAEAGLLLPYKWSREDLVDRILTEFEASDDEVLQRAARTFTGRRDKELLPAQLDYENKIAEFTDGYYASHRFAL